MRYDALVIGAGMSGLAAGIRLAQAGKRVAILERHYLWGGLNSFYKRAGRRFDTGLHALTNFVPRNTAGAPLTKILRQLRIPYDALELAPQSFSETAFAVQGQLVRLRYSNELDLMRSEVARLFPAESTGFERLVAALAHYTGGTELERAASARVRVAEFVRDPLLAEMLLVAPCFYGSASEDDMSWGDFGVLFRSIHLEGMARPARGIKALLDLLIGRFEAEGGELRMRNGVARIEVRDGCARAVLLDDGTRLEAEQIFSSAGLVETRALCGLDGAQDEHDIGRLSFVETISVLDRAPHELGYLATITFFNNGPTFRYARPDDFIDATSGVINCPNNYAHKTPLPEGLLRVTAIANHARFAALGEAEYRAAKDRSVERMLDAAAPFAFDPRPYSVERDSFSPTTIERFTGHRGGAIYGTPHKRRDGASGVAALHLIGTDAGQIGIVGALLSGIATANSAVLAPQGGAS